MTEGVTTIELTLSRIITEDGRMAVRIALPDDYSAVEILGLLAAAQQFVYSDMEKFT